MSKRKPKEKRSVGGCLFNVLTFLTLGAAVLVAGAFIFTYLFPDTIIPAEFRPLPAVPTVRTLTTSTPTMVNELPPTWTALAITETPTPLPRPSNTPIPSATEGPLVPLTTATDTPTIPVDLYDFELQSNEPIALQNVTHPELGCNFMGVGGQVFDLSGAPITQMVIHLGGRLANTPVDLITLTGTALQYGPGGYEFTLADAPIASDDTLYIELLNQAGAPISEKVFFRTFGDCEHNLILVNFSQVQ